MLISSKFTIFRLARSKDWTQTGYVTLFASLSAFGMARLLAERTVLLDEEEEQIWREHCDLLSPGEMRALLSCAHEKFAPIDGEPVQVLRSGSAPKLLLLLHGEMQIAVDQRAQSGGSASGGSASGGSASGGSASDVEARPLEARPPVLIMRGPGFTGEVSYISALVHAGSADEGPGAPHAVRADVHFLPGAVYLEFDMGALERRLGAQPALRNALVALLSRSMCNKLYATTRSLGEANERASEVHTRLMHATYRNEMLDVMLDSLASAVVADGQRDADGHAGSVALSADGVRLLQPRLEQLRVARGVSAAAQQRALSDNGLDLEHIAAERQSLVEICKTSTGAESARHVAQKAEVDGLLTAHTLVSRQTGHEPTSNAPSSAGDGEIKGEAAPRTRTRRLARLATLREDMREDQHQAALRVNEQLAVLGTLAM